MKTYLIDIEDKESLLQTLWEEIEANSSNGTCFVCAPCKNEITILETGAENPIARINLIKISDELDIKQDIFN